MTTLDIETENNLQYHYYPIASGSARFRVRSPKDAHIALTTGPVETNPIIEIIIGGWNNTKSVIRKNKEDVAKLDTPNILNKGQFKEFIIQWHAGRISVSQDNAGEVKKLMEWTDPDPFLIAYMGVYTGWGASGTWKINEGDEFDTPDLKEYQFSPVSIGYLDFQYKGPHNAHVCLTTGPEENDNIYEFIIGGWKNTQSVIRHNRLRPDKVTVPTPDLLNANKFKKFIIDWVCGRLVLRDYDSNTVIMEWVDPKPFPITYFGVRTGYGARGHWRINHYYKDKIERNGKMMVNDSSLWVDASAGNVPPGALVGGTDTTGEPLYVARALHGGSLVPGKLPTSHGCAFVSWDGKEHGKTKYQVLVDGPNTWVPTSKANIPPRALPGGETETGEPLFIGRVNHEGSLTVGKVQQSHGTCYIAYGGKEIGFSEYEILVA